MKLDAHHHLWKYSPEEYGWIGDDMKILKRNYLPDDLFPLLNKADLDGSIAVQARQTLEETRWLLRLADEYEYIRGVVGWVDLQDESIESQLAELATHQKLVAIRHVVQDEPDLNFIIRDDFLRGVELLDNYNLAYDILIFPKQLPNTIKFVSYFPRQRFVLDHIAKPFIKDAISEPWNEQITELATFQNVYCKVSGMVTEADWHNWKYEDFTFYIDTVFAAFGPERIMFGSDWPVCTVAAKYEQVFNMFNDYIANNYSEKEQNNLLSGNACRVYKIL